MSLSKRSVLPAASLLLLAACQRDDSFLSRNPLAIGGGATVQPFANQAAAIYYDAEVSTTYNPASGEAPSESNMPLGGVPERFRQVVTLFVARSGEFRMQIDQSPADDAWIVDHEELPDNRSAITRTVIADGALTLYDAAGDRLSSTSLEMPLLTDFAEAMTEAREVGDFDVGELLSASVLEGDYSHVYAYIDSVAARDDLPARSGSTSSSAGYAVLTLSADEAGIGDLLTGGEVTLLYDKERNRAVSIEVYDIRGRRVNGLAFDYDIVVDNPDALLRAMQQEYFVDDDPTAAEPYYVTTVSEFNDFAVSF